MPQIITAQRSRRHRKFSLNREVLKPSSVQRGYFSQPRWVLGLILVIGGSLGDFAALGFAAQSLIVPVGGLTLVANSIFARFGLKEKMTRLDVSATGLIMVGIIIAAVFANKESASFSISELIDLHVTREQTNSHLS